MSVLLTGAALVRERERETAEHLLICTRFGCSGLMLNDPLVSGYLTLFHSHFGGPRRLTSTAAPTETNIVCKMKAGHATA